MRIGLFGGSFNPPHNGHLMMAKRLQAEFLLDYVYFIVAKEPPHKEIAFFVSADMRYDMVLALLANEKSIAASDIELNRSGKSYTVDTIHQIKEANPDSELFFIMGEDMLLNFPYWRFPEQILALASIIAVSRPGVAGDIGCAAENLRRDFGARIYTADFSGLDMSSTEVRERIFDAQSTDDMLSESVSDYIYDNVLYMPKDIVEIHNKLRDVLSEKRLRHVCATMQKAVELANIYDADPKKARLAGLLHDCAKLSDDELLGIADAHGIDIGEYERETPSLLHDRVGAILAREVYGVNDADVLKAIADHQLLSKNVSILDKVVFLADKIERNRDYDGVNLIRKIARHNLDEAVVAFIDMNIEHIKSNGKTLHPAILSARECIIKQMNGGTNLNENVKEQVLKLCEVLDDKKAKDIVAINVSDKTIIADWFVICSGRAIPQVKSLADEAEDKAAELGLVVARKEGYQEGRWIVLDFQNILLHIFHPEERQYYNMERLWLDDPQNCIMYSQEREKEE